MYRILIIDDDPIFIDMIKTLLKDCEVIGVTKSKEGISKVKTEKYDMLIVDYLIDELNGSEVVEKIRKFNKELYIFMLTGCQDEAPGISILNNVEVQNYCMKDPENLEGVLISIKSALKSIEHFKNKEDISIAVRLKELRAAHNISQQKLAEIAGVQRAAVAQWEAGNNDPSLENLRKIAKHFKVSLDYLTGL